MSERLFEEHFSLKRILVYLDSNFRLQRYRRVKRKLIFNRFVSSNSSAKYYKFLEERHSQTRYLMRFESLYLDNRMDTISSLSLEWTRKFLISFYAFCRLILRNFILFLLQIHNVSGKNPSYLNNFEEILNSNNI